jgi:hypothetical protein
LTLLIHISCWSQTPSYPMKKRSIWWKILEFGVMEVVQLVRKKEKRTLSYPPLLFFSMLLYSCSNRSLSRRCFLNELSYCQDSYQPHFNYKHNNPNSKDDSNKILLFNHKHKDSVYDIIINQCWILIYRNVSQLKQMDSTLGKIKRGKCCS